MVRVPCPECRTLVSCDPRDEGRTIECPNCRALISVSIPVSDNDQIGVAKPDGSGSALLSFVLGGASLLSFLCFGLGAIFGFGGLLLGFAGLQSRFRGLSIFGMIMSLAGIIFSLGFLAIIVSTKAAMDRETPANPNGTKAPFVDK